MKKNLLTLMLLTVVGLLSFSADAQGRRGLKINEVMVQNDSNFVDDYGRHSAWIELFNSTFAPLEISSVYLTTDKNNPTMYPVPLGDVNTDIPRRQHVIFWADGRPSDGTFHTNFVLEPGKDNYIAIFDADGHTLIDEIVIPANLAPNTSYARRVDGEGVGPDAWEVRDGSNDKYITPSSNNIIKSENNKVKMFSDMDEHGFGMALMAMCIVFSALLVLSLCFLVISKIGEKVGKSNKMKAHGIERKETPRSERPDHDSGEEIAAIVMALREHLDAHDAESAVLTINKVKRAYSPWSSKIYNLRQLPNR